MPKPTKKALHPKMAERAAHVKAAHAHLAKHAPGFALLTPSQRMTAVQAHVTHTLKGR